ncbi:HAD family hydrolase [Lacrimispora sp.]|jgi:HAD superfamily hydrolase (TIGR01509 family)|uniref:HAD family hydrolase n=1 Tax=Lacrimispora sp. TaxID=2719234 RepID=UPI002896E812|nr:HAD family phosphatase [Lacrimispora sp.]
MIKAVIFDMDGVLIDSEIIYLDHMYEKLRFLYPQINREALFAVVGSTTKRTMEIVSGVIGEDVDSPAFQELYAGLWADCRPDYPSILRKEVPELLRELHRRGYLVALASSTSRAGIEDVLTSCGLKGDFDYIVSGEEFKESKPNPEIYLHTADTLKCEPKECLVVEDSTYGIMAGHGAGMTVISVIDERFRFDRSLADYFINGLWEVLDVLEELNEAKG